MTPDVVAVTNAWPTHTACDMVRYIHSSSIPTRHSNQYFILTFDIVLLLALLFGWLSGEGLIAGLLLPRFELGFVLLAWISCTAFNLFRSQILMTLSEPRDSMSGWLHVYEPLRYGKP